MKTYRLKRLFDMGLAISSLLALSPLLAITAFAIKVHDRGPVLFKHQRIGINGCLFWIYKFRSMPVTSKNLPSADATRISVTPVGRIIRRFSIDEMPQLFNIIKGDMSIVGPRPALPAQTELIQLRVANHASSCIPGLTGLAQINAFDKMPDSIKANWDGQYAHQMSLMNDLSIVLKTVAYILKPPPVY